MAKKRSWKQIVQEADPPTDLKDRPVVYEFVKGRKFRDKKDPYN